jgi:uncharacterized protein HemX
MKQSKPMDKLEMKLREQQHEEKDNHYRQTGKITAKLNLLIAMVAVFGFYAGYNSRGVDKEAHVRLLELEHKNAEMRKSLARKSEKNKILEASLKQFRSNMVAWRKQQKSAE